MQLNRPTTTNFFLTGFLLLFALAVCGQEKRAMTLDDVMGFHHIDAQTINFDGNWVAFVASPDRGDGYGVLVPADGSTGYRVERGVSPRFSAAGNWVLFTVRPPLWETEGRRPADRPNNAAVLISTSDGSRLQYDDVRTANFSQTREFIFVHQHVVEDTLLSKEENEKLKKAGGPLYVRSLADGSQVVLPFVDSFTVDSLATTLVFVKNDTLKGHNGLYALSLDQPGRSPQAVDTTGTPRFNRFTWFEKDSRLAYMRAEELEKDSVETAAVYAWRPGDNAPDRILGQADAPDGLFLPFDNRLVWTLDGQRLFIGFRPDQFAARPDEKPESLSVLDSIRAAADIDIWHGEDPLIKTHEKVMWNQVRRQNLMSVYHLADRRLVRLADEYLHDVQPARSGDFVLSSTNIPHARRITWEGRFRDVYVMNVHTGERQLVLEEAEDMTLLSPDGRHLLYFDQENWHVFHTGTGEYLNLTADMEVPFYNETHDRPSPPNSYRIAGWMEDGQSVLIYDRYDIWHANLTNGEMRNVTGGQGRETQTVLRIRRMDDKPLFGRRDEVFIEGFNEQTKVRAIYTARLDRQGVSLAMDVGQNLRLRDLSGDGSTVLFTHESQDVFPDLWVSNTRFRNPVQISHLHEQVEQFNWGKAELISYRSADGVPLQAIVIKPGDYDPSKKYPVFVYYYEQYSQRLHDFNQTVINHRPGFGFYASNGYVMLLPDIHFIEGRPGMSAVKSLEPAVQTIIDMGIADPNAIGLHGHSWSGYQTAYVVTQTDLFAAAVAGAPVSNMTSAYSGIRWGSGVARQFQYETGQSRIGYSLFDRRYLYIENSPVFYAHEINTPLLLMHGDVDDAVPWEQSIEMYLAMRRAGKDVIFLQYRDEPHHPQKYPNKIDYTIRMKEYFDYHLRGMAPPEWIREGIPYTGN